MPITIPLRLPREIVDRVDGVIAGRHGQSSRNAVLREAIVVGLGVLEAPGAVPIPSGSMVVEAPPTVEDAPVAPELARQEVEQEAVQRPGFRAPPKGFKR